MSQKTSLFFIFMFITFTLFLIHLWSKKICHSSEPDQDIPSFPNCEGEDK